MPQSLASADLTGANAQTGASLPPAADALPVRTLAMAGGGTIIPDCCAACRGDVA